MKKDAQKAKRYAVRIKGEGFEVFPRTLDEAIDYVKRHRKKAVQYEILDPAGKIVNSDQPSKFANPISAEMEQKTGKGQLSIFREHTASKEDKICISIGFPKRTLLSCHVNLADFAMALTGRGVPIDMVITKRIKS